MVMNNGAAVAPVLPGTPSLLRAINDRTALRLLAEHGPLSRTQIGVLAGLSKPTASQLMDRLLTIGLVEEVASAPSEADANGPGRVARLYRMRAGAAHVAGLDVTPARIVTRVCNLAGEILGEKVLPTPGRFAVDAVDRVREALTNAVADLGLGLEDLYHLVIGLGGAIDPQTGRLGYARHLPGWHDADLLGRLRTGLLTPQRLAEGGRHPVVDVENDVNLAAVAEQGIGGGAAGCGNFVVIWIADGIGAAVVIDGKLHRGATGGAGEVGYMPVPGAPRVRTLNRGANGGFQSIAGAPAVLKLARAHGFTGPDAPMAVARAVEAGPVGLRLLGELADRLAAGLAPIVAVLDPELIVLTGAILRAGGDPLRELVAESLHDMAIPRPRLVLSEVPDNPVLAGAIQAALAATREAVFATTFPAAV